MIARQHEQEIAVIETLRQAIDEQAEELSRSMPLLCAAAESTVSVETVQTQLASLLAMSIGTPLGMAAAFGKIASERGAAESMRRAGYSAEATMRGLARGPRGHEGREFLAAQAGFMAEQLLSSLKIGATVAAEIAVSTPSALLELNRAEASEATSATSVGTSEGPAAAPELGTAVRAVEGLSELGRIAGGMGARSLRRAKAQLQRQRLAECEDQLGLLGIKESEAAMLTQKQLRRIWRAKVRELAQASGGVIRQSSEEAWRDLNGAYEEVERRLL